MTLPVKGGRITASFDQPRPLSDPGKWIHGAIDIAGGDGIVRCPVDGIVRALVFIRPDLRFEWPRHEKKSIQQEPCNRYFYDTYGGMIVIEAIDKKYHILSHFYISQLQDAFGQLLITEQQADARFPAFMLSSATRYMDAGTPLCRMGNAGYSTGAHLHWEIHPTKSIYPHRNRVDPTEYIKE